MQGKKKDFSLSFMPTPIFQLVGGGDFIVEYLVTDLIQFSL